MDYTPINAHRKGTDGFQGSFLPRMGRVVRHIYSYSQQHGQHCFYLAENAALSNHEEKELEVGDLERVMKAFTPRTAGAAAKGDPLDADGDPDIIKSLATPWHYKLDSADLTPLRRLRTYITNIPSVDDLGFFDAPPRTCFDDDFDVGGGVFEPKILAKAPGLMATKSRLDDHPRMSIYRELSLPSSAKLVFERRAPTVQEREHLMGFFPGYVSAPGMLNCSLLRLHGLLRASSTHSLLLPSCIATTMHYEVDELFSELLHNGLERDQSSNNWKEHLPERFHEFAGDYHGLRGEDRPFKFDFNPLIILELAPPLATKTVRIGIIIHT